jgi:hypothetical protein
MERKTDNQGTRIEWAAAGSNWSTLRTLFVELLAHRGAA